MGVTGRERVASRLVGWYPVQWSRDGRTEEMREMLHAHAQTAGGQLSTAELADLAVRLLSARGAAVLPQAARRRVAELALVTGSALAAALFLSAEWQPWASEGRGHIHHMFGPFFTDGPLVYLPWLVMTATALTGHRRMATALSTVTGLLTGTAVIASLVLPIWRPHMVVVLALALLQIGTLPGLGAVTRSSSQRRAVMTAATLTAAAALSLRMANLNDASLDSRSWFYLAAQGSSSGFNRLQTVLPIAVPCALLIAAVVTWKHRGWFSAAAVVSLPWILLALQFSDLDTRLGQSFLIVACSLCWAVLIAAGRLAVVYLNRKPVPAA